jgi:thiamine biosynthesis lipoprotein
VEPRKIVTVGGILVALAAWSMWGRTPTTPAVDAVELSGEVQGTFFHIRLAEPALSTQRLAAVSTAVREILDGINRQMSLWDPESSLCRFNRAPAGPSMPIPEDFAACTRFALELAQTSGGAFDPTLRPLLRLWGFGGPEGPRTDAPPEAEQEAVRARCGWRLIGLDSGGLRKSADGVELDLNAVAQGHSVDVVARQILAMGVTNFFVEIGGEVFVSGRNASGDPWRIGIDEPRPDSLPGEHLAGILHISGCAVATSGGYRNRRTDAGGSSITHIFDARTGRPSPRERLSVTVVAPDCLTADGLATTLFILGPDEGLPWLATNHPSAEALFVAMTGDDSPPTLRASGGFLRRTAMTPGH